MTLNERQEALCAANTTDFSDLRALILNCTLKRPEERSHTALLLSVPEEIMRKAAWRWRWCGPRRCRSPSGSSPT